MKPDIKHLTFTEIAVMFLSLFAVSACIYDDRSECVLNIRFTYTYNVKDADAFSAEVKEIEFST